MRKSAIMTLAHGLRKAHGLDKEAALKRAWAMSRQERYFTKVRGVSHGKRQLAIVRLAQYNASEIRIWLVREPGNPADRNAVAVVAEVIGKGCAKLGYLAAGHAAVVAPVLDRLGGKLRGNLEAITGGNGRRYGVNISFTLATDTGRAA
ncbi:HIRAN domain-containing protein [Desulfofundulus kuznetsovii DSM 6115]|uniref:HIRAN domain-containing protein n=1 Tax=Desulfofundulus kuznetsovii (strain DSM 6115 / VKM B-1805 / 17) TaxID=760568 RepID=A0AAU8PFZ0_DESK7|nr:HIRAN domain-containing protein [Desulfofundulus kuznetsovii DSM 6115]